MEPVKDDPQVEEWAPKRASKRSKVHVNRSKAGNTRRSKRIDSEEQPILPPEIPISFSKQLVFFQSFDREETKCIIQIPLGLLNEQVIDSDIETRAQKTRLRIKITKEGNDTLICGIQLKKEGQESVEHDQTIKIYNVWGKYSWVANAVEIQNKIIKSGRKEANCFEFNEIATLKYKDASSDMFVILHIREEKYVSTQYNGLINQGNTCYMNSYLQMLFHIGQFRKLVFQAEIKDQNKFPATLQALFYKMITDEKAVSPELLVKSFGWSKKEAQVQQDAQQFSCLFFEVLEKKLYEACPLSKHLSMDKLFEGELTHYIECSNVVDYRTENIERFFDLQLSISPDLVTSFEDYVSEQILDQSNMYRTDLYGEQPAKKGVRISQLPPILMIQIKRFIFNPYSQTNQKLLDKFTYPKKIDLSRWTFNNESTNEYELYGVLVHEGSQASSGHYYAILHLGNRWFKFNDESVTEVDEEKAFEYNFGGFTDIIEYDYKNMRVNVKEHHNKATAYMLVYMSKEMKESLLNTSGQVYPQWLINSQSTRLEMEEEKKIRKQSICSLDYYSFALHFQDRPCSQKGLFSNLTNLQSLCLNYNIVAKQQKFDNWIQNITEEHDKLASNKNIMSKDYINIEETLQKTYVFLYWVQNDKEVLISARSRRYLLVQDFFKDTISPFVFFANVEVLKDEFLVIVKKYTNKNLTENDEINYKFQYDYCTKIAKNARKSEMVEALRLKYLEGKYSYKFYIEERSGLMRIQQSNHGMLPSPTPAKNQLLVVVVEQTEIKEIDVIEVDKSEDIHQANGVVTLYNQHKGFVVVTLKNEATKEQIEKELHEDISLRELREYIFNEVLELVGSSELSADNILLKCKGKKNSKLFVEVLGAIQLKELLSKDTNILYSLSKLNAKQRQSQRELSFYYRNGETLNLSEEIRIVIEKEDVQERLLDSIKNSKLLFQYLSENNQDGLRFYLMSRDRFMINDLIDQKGYIPGKGEIGSVLDREKGLLLVAEGYSLIKSHQHQDTQPPTPLANILIHHIIKTGEKLGLPRWIKVPKTLKLYELKLRVVDLIYNEYLEWEGKNIAINAYKIRLLAYVKEMSRSIELPDPPEQKMQQNQQPINGQLPVNDAVNLNGINENEEVYQISKSEMMDIQNNQQKGQQLNDEKKDQEERVMNCSPSRKNSYVLGSEEEPIQLDKKVQELILADNKKNQEIPESQQTIESKFGKSKWIRVAIVHNSISKGIQPLRLMVE